ncbi:hypothetical protein F5Y10DRAFT_243036 [Nemania abortiva]|nr:hypothetical protein F5Y10DRAFT_243036 [Nemania abortiva]
MNIPGYYYDAEKHRYFKIESSNTAPKSAAWSSDNAKRRKLHDEDAAAALRHLSLAKSRIRRAKVLHDPLTGGFFAREYGAMRDDMQAACFAKGLQNKGCARMNDHGCVRRMYIDGQADKTGMCTAYAAVDLEDTILLATYFPRDKNQRLDQRLLANYRIPPSHQQPLYIEAVIPQISDIKYHAPSNSMFVTSRQPSYRGQPNSLWEFHPQINDFDTDPSRPRWLIPSIGTSASRRPSKIPLGSRNGETYCVAPAPASSPLVCVVGTSRGVLEWDWASGTSALLAPPAPVTDLLHDVFAIDFHPSQAAVYRFGGRPGALFTADSRVPRTEWSYLRLPSTITHLRCLDSGNQILAAGLRNQLGIYDLRFARSYRGIEDEDVRIDSGTRDGRRRSDNRKGGPNSSRQSCFRDRKRWNRDGKQAEYGKDNHRNKTAAQPVIRFERYRNAAHTDIGFAFDAATGVVATAQDIVPGTVALYSVRTGSQLRVLDLAKPSKGAANLNHDHRTSRRLQPISHAERANLPVIQSLQFQTFPGDHTPTLFVGNGGNITAFSFGVDNLEDEA